MAVERPGAACAWQTNYNGPRWGNVTLKAFCTKEACTKKKKVAVEQACGDGKGAWDAITDVTDTAAHAAHSHSHPDPCNESTVPSHATLQRGRPAAAMAAAQPAGSEATQRPAKRMRCADRAVDGAVAGAGAAQSSDSAPQPLGSKRITAVSQLEQLFHLSREEAAARVGCSITYFKTQCRAFGVCKWPVRPACRRRNTKWYSSTYLAMGVANARAGTRYPPEH